MKRLVAAVCLFLLAPLSLHAWGPQGHRLVAEIAFDHLTPEAHASVQELLGHESLADVSSWADAYLDGNFQTFYWHFINIPPDAAGYDRDRDCLLQPGVTRGSTRDHWRDCAVERIPYNAERIANPSLDRADRAIALKFLVHIVGDLHQPFHALGVGHGGNDIPVTVFGSPDCGDYKCNLHEVWDEKLIERRGLDDSAYLKVLETGIAAKKMTAGTGTSVDWAMESRDLGRAALVAAGTNIDEAYYARNIATVDQRLEQGGLRLAALINAAFAKAPVEKVPR
ncbi:S1/P1 nuclease [Granulicella sibirica]|uniref:Endonuclease n=1 Tax=Granulicella sibirica TaxID=2479048 RepID=A0A4Q0SXG1_9BACT|nr:S1/P1 nuclease [Granulicella sibirica]RXH54298.1 Endonuclease [Granulicella sibirica]